MYLITTYSKIYHVWICRELWFFGGFGWLVIVVGLLVYFWGECVDPVKKQLTTVRLRTNGISIKIKCCLFFFLNNLIMYINQHSIFIGVGKNYWNCISVPCCRDLVLCCEIWFNSRMWIGSWNTLKVGKINFVLVEDTSGCFIISLSLTLINVHITFVTI